MTSPNPYNRYGPPMRLYGTDRIMQAEGAVEFRRMLDGRPRRKRAAARNMRRRRSDYERWARGQNLRCRFPESLDAAYRLGHKRHVERMERPDWRLDGCGFMSDDPLSETEHEQLSYDAATQADLDRWAVNYLRHECTGYDDVLVVADRIVKPVPSQSEAGEYAGKTWMLHI